MNATKCTNSKKSAKNSSENQETKNSKRLETRRRIEDLFEEKRLRNEMELDY